MNTQVAREDKMEEETCRTCGQVASRPYRRRIQGVVTEGCTGAFHDMAMRRDGWHNQPSAKALRREIAARAGLGRKRPIEYA